MSQTNKKFVTGAFVLAAAGILAKCLSIFFRIPLSNMIGDEGMGYYQLPYPIYSFLLSISYVGLPSAISKLVSERVAKKKYGEAHQIFKYTFILLFVIGLLSSLFMFFGAETLITAQNWPEEAIYSIYGLALAPLLVSIMGAYRGYFQGMQNMKPTAISQLVESFLRVIVGIGLAAVFLNMFETNALGMAAGGASFGATAGAFGGALVLIVVYYLNRKSIKKNIETDTEKPSLNFSKASLMVVMIALPISLGSAINSIISMIDSNVIVKTLQTALSMTESRATELFGMLTGRVNTLINAPLTVSMALVLSMMPAVAEAVAKNDKEELHDKINLGVRLSILIGFPAAAGLASLATPILKLLYPKYSTGGDTVAILSIALIFIILGQLFAAALQGMGKFYTPVVNLLISAVFKYVLTVILVANPVLNINGAAIATTITYMIYSLLNYISLKKHSGYRITDYSIIYKPLVSTIGMALVAMSGYYFSSKVLPNSISTIIAIGFAVIVYFVLLLATNAIKDEDFEIFPMGDKIKRVLRR